MEKAQDSERGSPLREDNPLTPPPETRASSHPKPAPPPRRKRSQSVYLDRLIDVNEVNYM